MRSFSAMVVGFSLVTMAQAQTPLPEPFSNEVQVVTYIDLEAGQAVNGSSLLVKQVQVERRNASCRIVVLIEEDDRRNHFMAVKTWHTSRDLDAFRNSDSYKRFRSKLQPMLASPLDERVGHQIAP